MTRDAAPGTDVVVVVVAVVVVVVVALPNDWRPAGRFRYRATSVDSNPKSISFPSTIVSKKQN